MRSRLAGMMRGLALPPRLGLVVAAVLGLTAPAPAAAESAAATLVVDARSGRILQATHADKVRHPASLTKMMTLYMLFEAIDRGAVKLDERMPVSRAAAARPPTKLWLKPGATIGVRDAILALVTLSANDAAVVVAERLGRSEAKFAQLMTRRARALGMADTTFGNASGLPDPRQRTTARDLATLARALLRDFPHHYRFFETRAFRYAGSAHRNHNRLLGTYAGVDGIKTGFTQAAGFNLVASARRGDRRLIGVVLGARTSQARNALMVRLLDRGFASASGRGPAETAQSSLSRRGPAAAPNLDGRPLAER